MVVAFQIRFAWLVAIPRSVAVAPIHFAPSASIHSALPACSTQLVAVVAALVALVPKVAVGAVRVVAVDRWVAVVA